MKSIEKKMKYTFKNNIFIYNLTLTNLKKRKEMLLLYLLMQYNVERQGLYFQTKEKKNIIIRK